MTLESKEYIHKTECSWNVFSDSLASFGQIGLISDPHINFKYLRKDIVITKDQKEPTKCSRLN